MIEQNWAAFDVNKDGSINFKEFVCGLSTILRGSVDERLKCKSTKEAQEEEGRILFFSFCANVFSFLMKSNFFPFPVYFSLERFFSPLFYSFLFFSFTSTKASR